MDFSEVFCVRADSINLALTVIFTLEMVLKVRLCCARLCAMSCLAQQCCSKLNYRRHHTRPSHSVGGPLSGGVHVRQVQYFRCCRSVYQVSTAFTHQFPDMHLQHGGKPILYGLLHCGTNVPSVCQPCGVCVGVRLRLLWRRVERVSVLPPPAPLQNGTVRMPGTAISYTRGVRPMLSIYAHSHAYTQFLGPPA